ncbi:uncharacterized protein NEMAJ01_2390, partial [Nematocida major]|uniref:uncharacterized protein n=1 Tax=Nematocida major TaxID=1912982 RepID=UPI002007E34B
MRMGIIGAYRYVLSESLYFRRAVLLQPLTPLGSDKKYTFSGLFGNLLCMCASMLASASSYKTLSSYDGKSPFFLYISMGKGFGLFAAAFLLGVISYSGIFGFSIVESGYVIAYSFSAVLPVGIFGKSLQLYFTGYSGLGVAVLACSGAVSGFFVWGNSVHKEKVGKRILNACSCFAVQLLLSVFSDSEVFGVFV